MSPWRKWAVAIVAMLLVGVPVGRLCAAGPANVVLVHGIWDEGKIFAPMIRVLEARGHHCLAPSLTPNDCRTGVRVLTHQLSAQIDARFGKSAPVILIGFSMGGIITRDYVQNLAPAGRVCGVFLISTPNRGTLWASFARGGSRDLGLHGSFIEALNRDLSAWSQVPVNSYWTPLDLMVVPATSCRWPADRSRSIFCLLHPWMVRNQGLIADVAAKIEVSAKN